MYTKRLSELEVINMCKKGLYAIIVNPSEIDGEGDQLLNSGFLIKYVYERKYPLVPPGGRGVVSVDDVVEGHILAMEKGKAG